MNYTEVYKKLYASLTDDYLSHEEVHRFAVKITDALNELFSATKYHEQCVIDTVSTIANQMWNPLNLGGFDLDDKGQPL
jgi:hypothetical protein